MLERGRLRLVVNGVVPNNLCPTMVRTNYFDSRLLDKHVNQYRVCVLEF